MGTFSVITEIEPSLLTYWMSFAGWQNIRIVQPGIARKFQVVYMPSGDRDVSYIDTVVGVAQPQYNDGAFLQFGFNTSIFDTASGQVNDMLIVGNAETTVFTNQAQNLPFGVFWAFVKPMIIQYSVGGVSYTRAILNKVSGVSI